MKNCPKYLKNLTPIHISQTNPIGFSNRERLAAPLINLYMVKCQVTKTIEGAQEPPERGRRETSQAPHSRATRHMQPIQAGTQTANQDTQATPQESLPKRRAGSCTQGGSNQTTKMPPQGETIDNCSCFDGVWCWMVLSTPEKMVEHVGQDGRWCPVGRGGVPSNWWLR